MSDMHSMQELVLPNVKKLTSHVFGIVAFKLWLMTNRKPTIFSYLLPLPLTAEKCLFHMPYPSTRVLHYLMPPFHDVGRA